jgi:glycosyltransferase involved in cell wall biosynthesis
MTSIDLDSKPLISIVLVTYNSSRTVEDTLESAKAQTYPKIELIISDDGSIDETVGICKNWLEQNKDRFINSELITVSANTGIPANCNRGYKAAQGDWIKVIAGDDALFDNCVELNYNYVTENKEIGILLSEMKMYNNTFDADNFSRFFKIDLNNLFYKTETTADYQFKTLLIADIISITPTLFIKKSIVEQVGYFDERFKHIEDYPFWLKITRMGFKLYFMDKVTVKYRKHNQSIQNNFERTFLWPAYFKNEPMRKVYVYPYLNSFQFFYQKYCFYWAIIFRFFNKNNYDWFSFRLYNLLTFKSSIYNSLKSK